jgi:DNA polymerase sigma
MFDHAATVESVCAVVRQLFEQAAIPVRWVAPFGSSIAGLAVEQMCDVDVCVLCSAHPVDVFAVAKQMCGAANATHRDSLLGTGQGKRLVEQATLQRAYEIMQADSRVQKVELVISAKVPILKLELGTVPVDVCVNRPAGVINSLLLRRLTEIEPRGLQLWHGW